MFGIDRMRNALLIQSASGKHRDWLESAATGNLLRGWKARL